MIWDKHIFCVLAIDELVLLSMYSDETICSMVFMDFIMIYVNCTSCEHCVLMLAFTTHTLSICDIIIYNCDEYKKIGNVLRSYSRQTYIYQRHTATNASHNCDKHISYMRQPAT